MSDRPLVLDSYARESQRRGGNLDLSIAGQHDANVRRIGSHRSPEGRRATVGKQLTDRGKTAWEPESAREGWDMLLARLESGESDGVAVFDVERFARLKDDALRMVSLAERGVIFLDSAEESAADAGTDPFDLTTAQGIDAFREAAVAADYFSTRMSSRVKRGLDARTKQGLGKPGRYRPFGFEEDATTVRQPEAEAARYLAPQVLHYGMTWADARKWLEENGFPTTTSGKPWTDNSVREMMRAPRMAGKIKNGEKIVGTLPGEPILDTDTWRQLVSMIESRRGAPPSESYLASGIVVCHACGGVISGRPAQNGIFYPDGEPQRKYRCRKTKTGGCGRTIGDARALDRTLAALTISRLSDPRHVERIKRRAEKQEQVRARHERELDRLKRLLSYWDAQLNAGEIDIDRHAAVTADVEARIEREERAVALVGLTLAPALGRDDAPDSVNDARAKWDSPEMTTAERRELVRRTFQGFRLSVEPGSIRDTDFRGRLHITPVEQTSGS